MTTYEALSLIRADIMKSKEYCRSRGSELTVGEALQELGNLHLLIDILLVDEEVKG